METYQKLLLQNKAWVQEKLQLAPDYFKHLASIQNPEFLWIGCADSRVPANEITGTEPGEVFVHRNIANMVVHTDLNMLSVLQYAVQVLKVKHVIVCGHYGCGGVKAAMTNQNFGLINKWLRNIKDIYRIHQDELLGIGDLKKRENRLVELNVQEQVLNLAKTSIIQSAWHENNAPTLHGWVYGLEDGLLNDLCIKPPNSEMDKIFLFDHDDK
ncbi:carbonate dehydratase [Flammeovirgaceae bacterium SG7u.111]|nr:carbonate dehydratase [Flammeovirgaceae bacterium SG7u.132]WPO33782.1 carbonate dehydratase [Flammeovirgaceae bacterium SG7u.111]